MRATVSTNDALLGGASVGKIGMWIFLLSDGFSFAGLLLAYGSLRAGSARWWPEGEPALGVGFTAVLTFLLIATSLSMVLAVVEAQAGKAAAAARYLWLTALGGALFLLGQAQEYFGFFAGAPGLVPQGLVLGQSLRASTFYVITSFHGLHVLAGVLYLSATAVRVRAGRADAGEVEVAGLFWHFVDLVWILVFTFVYLF
jgi:cytochrome c oxidase subunit 3